MEKERRASGGLWGGKARWSWETSKRTEEEDPYATLEGLKRRKVVGDLSRAASKLKRDISRVDKRASLRRPAHPVYPLASAIKPFEPLTLQVEPKEQKVHVGRESPELDLSRATKMTERAEGEVKRPKRPNRVENVGASAKNGGVSSVRGPMKAAAIAKLGLRVVNGRTMRVIEKEE